MAKTKTAENKDELDMTPMIDLVFLLIIFFILAGKISNQSRTEQITVPPTKTATKIDNPERIIINVFGNTKSGDLKARGQDDYTAYQGLRQLLNKQYDLCEKIPDPKAPGLMIPKDMVVEIRADADTEYRVVQEVLQVVTDSVDPFNNMTPRNVAPANMKPFININYTTRIPGDS